MRFFFCTTGGAGHLLPLRPLAEALQAQGHEVAWATAPDALPFLAGLGFDLFAVGPNFHDSRSQFRRTFPEAVDLPGERLSGFTFPRLFGAVLAPAMLGDLDRALRQWQPDCVVHEPAVLAVPLLCQRLGLIHVAQGYGLRPPADYLLAAMDWFGPQWWAQGLAVPADGGVFRHLYLDIAPAGLQAPAPGPADRANRAEWPFNPYRTDCGGPLPLPPVLQALLQGPAMQRPHIYLSFGTVFNHHPALVTAAQAAARLGGSLVVTVGANGDPDQLAGLPGLSQVLTFVDQRALLPHCDAVVSHGGAGTTWGAAAHGLPHLVLPQAADHFRNAEALTRAGAGAAVSPAHQTVHTIESALRALLADASLAAGARRLACEMAAMADAADMACRLAQWLTSKKINSAPLRPR